MTLRKPGFVMSKWSQADDTGLPVLQSEIHGNQKRVVYNPTGTEVVCSAPFQRPLSPQADIH